MNWSLLTCHGKVPHTSYRSAAHAIRNHTAAAKCMGKDRPAMVPYKCRHCGWWHVANADRTQTLNNRRRSTDER